MKLYIFILLMPVVAFGGDSIRSEVLQRFNQIAETGKPRSGVKVSEKEVLLLRLILNPEVSRDYAESEYVKHIRDIYAGMPFSADGASLIVSSSGSRSIISDLGVLLLISKQSANGLVEYTRLTGQSVDVLGFIQSVVGREPKLDPDLANELVEYSVYALLDQMNKSRLDFYMGGEKPGVSQEILLHIASLKNEYPNNAVVERLAWNYILEYDSSVGAAIRMGEAGYTDYPRTEELLSDYFFHLNLDHEGMIAFLALIKGRFSGDIYSSFCAELLSNSSTSAMPNEVMNELNATLGLFE